MEDVNSGLVDLNWRERGGYPALDELCKKMTFDDALKLVFSLSGISKSDVEIDSFGGAVSEPISTRDEDSLMLKRAGAWNTAMEGLLTSDFLVQPGEICVQLSRDLGVVSGSKANITSRNPEELSKLYASTISSILLSGRIKFGRVPYVEPRLGPKLPEDLRQQLSEVLSGSSILEGEGRVDEADMRDILFLNHEILQKYRRCFSEAGRYPIERTLQQDPGRISEYCYALLRLVLGESENFSEVLQESFVLEEVTSLSRRYFPECCKGKSLWDAEISSVVSQLRDLRVRAFEHNCLMTCRVPTSGVITPPGRLVGPDAKGGVAVDFGAGPYARFFNAMARGNPDRDFYAVDKKYRREYDLSSLNSPKMHFVPGDFNDVFCVDSLVSRFGDNVDMMNLSNVLHKLKDPVGFLRVIFGKMLGKHGRVNVCMPAISGFTDGSGRHVGMRSLVAMGYEDTTDFWESFLTIEVFLDVIRSMSNLKIMSIAFADSRLSENDMAKRMFVALRKD